MRSPGGRRAGRAGGSRGRPARPASPGRRRAGRRRAGRCGPDRACGRRPGRERSSTPRCWVNDGRAMAKGRARSLVDAGPRPRRSTTARRVGSASAWKTVSRSASRCLGMCLSVVGVGGRVNPSPGREADRRRRLTRRRAVWQAGRRMATDIPTLLPATDVEDDDAGRRAAGHRRRRPRAVRPRRRPGLGGDRGLRHRRDRHRAVRQALGAHPGPEALPDLPHVQGDPRRGPGGAGHADDGAAPGSDPDRRERPGWGRPEATPRAGCARRAASIRGRGGVGHPPDQNRGAPCRPPRRPHPPPPRPSGAAPRRHRRRGPPPAARWSPGSRSSPSAPTPAPR